MNDVDITGPLPIVSADEPPAGWIPEGRHAPASEPPAPAAVEPTGADPDLPWDFATEPSPPRAAEVAGVESDPGEPSHAEPSPAEVTTSLPLVEDAGSVTADLPVVAATAATGATSATGATAPAPADDAAVADDLAGPVVPPTEAEDTPEPATEVGGAVPPASPPQGGSRSRHGQPPPLSRTWNAGVRAAIAIAAVVVGIIAFKHGSGSPSTSGAGPAFVLPTVAPSTGTNLSSPPPGLSALPKASAGASGAASAGASAGSSASASAAVPANAPSVTVLNETTTKGLAASEAEKLRAAGWTIHRVTNVSAHQTQTTVFYDASQEAAAKALLATVPSVKVALPRPSYLLSTGGLIVVVASDAA